MFGRTVGPAELIFEHKMYLWRHSDLGYLKIKNYKILAPCWEFLIFAKNQEILIFRKRGQKGVAFLIFAKNQEILIFRKRGQKGAIFMKSLPKWKDWILRPYGLYMQKIGPQKPAKQLRGIFYMPILFYNTKFEFGDCGGCAQCLAGT